MSFLDFFSKNVHTKFVKNITGNYDNIDFSMFKTQCYFNNILYSCDRIHKNGRNGLYLHRSDWNTHIEYGFDIDAEDPRMIIFDNTVYIIFNCLSPYPEKFRSMGITAFDFWNPMFLQLENNGNNFNEKNWTPFVKDEKLYFVYNFDPLIIIYYNFNKDGICEIIFKQENCCLPFNTEHTCLRGGSNLLHYKDEYYIGVSHSMIRIKEHHYEYYSHVILLDTEKYELIYVSKPLLFYYDNNEYFKNSYNNFEKINKINNVIIERIQYCISLYLYNDNYYITVHIRDCITFLFEIKFDKLFCFTERNKPINYFQNYTYETIKNINLIQGTVGSVEP